MRKEKVFFTNKKRERLAGILHTPNRENPPIVIMVHGFKGDKDYYEVFKKCANELCRNDYSVLLIDCRGSGESDGKFEDVTRKSEAQDILTAMDYVKTLNINPNKIGLIGTSMGVAAIILAYNTEMKCLVLMNPTLLMQFEYYKKRYKGIEKTGFKIEKRKDGREFKVGMDYYKESISLDMSSYLKKIDSPVLCLMGSEEYSDLQEKNKEGFELIRTKEKEMKIIPGGKHVFTGPEVIKQVVKETVDWFDKWLK